MTWSLPLFSVRGVPIRLHATFGLVLVFIGWRASVAVGPVKAATEAMLIVLLFVCVVLHELGHTLAALRRGVPITAITLYPFGGLAKLGRSISDGRVEMEIAAAGPMVNLVLAALCYVLTGGVPEHADSSFVHRLMWLLVWANLLLAGFNLLPAFPLDGGRVLRGALARRLGPLRATIWAASIGQIGAVVLIGVGIFHDPWLILAGLLVFPGANTELQRALGLRRLRHLTVGDLALTNLEHLDASATLQAAADRSRAAPDRDFVVGRGETWVGFLPAGRLWSMVHNGTDETTPLVNLALQLAHPLPSSTPIAEAAETLRRAGLQAAPVTRSGQLVGLITLASLSRATRLARAVADREE
jgi:stage IV sporulation protein FB